MITLRNNPRILVAGIGNIFLGDDAFGVHTAQRLLECDLPADVRVVDFGIRALDLAYALMDEYELVILVDAAQRGGAPGTLYLIEPDIKDLENSDDPSGMVDGHTMDPVKVLRLARYLGATPKRLLLVGCEPQEFGTGTEGQMGLSKPVEASLEGALRMVRNLIAQHLEDIHPCDGRSDANTAFERRNPQF